jgi:hypothetical protein
MHNRYPTRLFGVFLAIATASLLSACGSNTYGPPPPNGAPQNWGQQHYLDVQKYREQNEDRMN